MDFQLKILYGISYTCVNFQNLGFEWSRSSRRINAQQLVATKGSADQHGQRHKLAGKVVGTRLASFFARGGRRGPSAGAGRPAASNPMHPGARAGRSGGAAAWGPTPASSGGGVFRTLYLTGSGWLWMARKRMLLLRSGGQVDRRGRRS